MFNRGLSMALAAAMSAVKTMGFGSAGTSKEKVGERVKGKNHKMAKRRHRTPPDMLRRRACCTQISEDGKTMRFVRGKLIGGKPMLWRP